MWLSLTQEITLSAGLLRCLETQTQRCDRLRLLAINIQIQIQVYIQVQIQNKELSGAGWLGHDKRDNFVIDFQGMKL